jgi:hypothetical protein
MKAMGGMGYDCCFIRKEYRGRYATRFGMQKNSVRSAELSGERTDVGGVFALRGLMSIRRLKKVPENSKSLWEKTRGRRNVPPP